MNRSFFIPPAGFIPGAEGPSLGMPTWSDVGSFLGSYFANRNKNGEVDTTWGFEDADGDGIPDFLEGGADCDQIYENLERAKAAKKAAQECLDGGPKKRRRRRQIFTKSDMDAITFMKSQGFSKADIVAVLASRPR